METIARLLKIGEVANLSGLPVKTVRYYEEIGLLSPTVDRTSSGYRLFSHSVLSRLAFIRRAQGLGLSLQEIQQILTVRDHGQLPCHEVKHYLQAKVAVIQDQIEALESLKGELQDILSHWQEDPSKEAMEQTICPNLQ